jgi:hypothetical protein
MTAPVQLTIERVRRIMWLSQDRDPLTPQEIEMLEDLIATGPCTDRYSSTRCQSPDGSMP